MAVAVTRTDNVAGVNPSSNVSTHSAVAIGTGNTTNRKVVICVTKEVATTVLSSATIDYGSGDVSMSAVIGNAFGSNGAYICHLNMPAGTSATTATIKLTWSSTITSADYKMAVYTAVSAASALASSGNDTSSDIDANDPLTTGSSTIPSNGALIACASCATDTTTKTWANITGDLTEDAGAWRHVTGTSTSAGTATRTLTGSTNNEDGALAWIIVDQDLNATITGGLMAADDVFHTSTLTIGIEGSLFADDVESFQTSVVGQSQEITGSLFVDTDILSTHDVVELDIFYGHAFTSLYPIDGNLYSDDEVFQTAALSFTLTGSLYGDTDTFFVAEIADAGDAQIEFALHPDNEQFFACEVATFGEEQDITGSLFVDDEAFHDSVTHQIDIFYRASFAATFPATGDYYNDTDTFYTSLFVVDLDIAPALFENSQTYYEPLVTFDKDIDVERLDNTQTIYTHSVSAGIFPALLENTQTFYDAEADDGAIDILPSLVTNTQTFNTHTIGRGTVAIFAGLITNTNTFFTSLTQANAAISHIVRWNNEQVVNTHTVGRGAVAITPSVVVNTQTIAFPGVSGPPQVIFDIDRLDNVSEIYEPMLAQGPALLTFEISVVRGRLY